MDHSSDMAEPHPKKPKMETSEGLHNFNPPSASTQTYLNLSVNNLKSFLMEDTLDVDHNSADNLSVVRFNERETFVINAPTSIISHWSLDFIPCLEIFASNYTKQQILCQWTSTLLAALRQIPYCAVKITIVADEPHVVICPTNSCTFLRCTLWRFLLNYKSFMPSYLCQFLEAEFTQLTNLRPYSKVPSQISPQSPRSLHNVCNKVTDLFR